MIPLKSSEGVSRFPRSSLLVIIVIILLDLLSRFWPGPRLDFLNLIAHNNEWKGSGLLSFLFHPHFFSLFINLIYLWAFTPKLFEERSPLLQIFIAIIGVELSFLIYQWVHPYISSPILAPETFTAALMGLSGKRSIWESTSTLVVGPGWIRVYEVPSYVLLFFFLFYLLISQLLMPEPFNEAPMPYLMPLVSFLWGFGVSLCLKRPSL